MKKLNKKGMTLVEVLVAMTILTIVVTPTLRMFASSLGTNLRSKRNQRAITIGESVMETFKAYTMESLCNQFLDGNYQFASGSTPGTTGVTANFADGSTGVSPLRVNKTLKEDATEYLFTMTGATMDVNSYDIDIKVTPQSNPQVVNFESYNAYTDAFVKLEESYIDVGSATPLSIEGDILDYFRSKAKDVFFGTYPSSSYSVDEVKTAKVKRQILVTITDDGSSGVQKVTESIIYTCGEATIKYHYSMPDPHSAHGLITGSGSTTVTLTEATGGKYVVKFYDGGGTESETKVVYDNSGTIAGGNVNGRKLKLNNVYLYYFPMYDKIFGDDAEDEITIDSDLTADNYGNSGSDPKGRGLEPLNVYIVKQCSTILDDIALNTAEVSYQCSVDGTHTGGGEITLRHAYLDKDGHKAKLKESLTDVPAAVAISSSAFTNVEVISEGISEKTNLIYKIEVDVYEAGTGKTHLLTQYTGTINE